MSASNEGRTAHRKLPVVVLSTLIAFVGLMGLYRVMQSPQFESYRTVDVIQLVASGVWIGSVTAGLQVLFQMFPRLDRPAPRGDSREEPEA